MYCFPLSFSQKNILDLERILPGTSVNHICTTLRIKGTFEIRLLQESIHQVLEKDRSMHIRMVDREDGTFQYYASYQREDFPIYDFSNVRRDSFESWEEAMVKKTFRLDGPLYFFAIFKEGENGGGVFIKCHHLIADGWSMLSLCNKICRTYLELTEEKQISLVDSPDYEGHVIEEQKYLESAASGKDEAYWKQILEKEGEAAAFKPAASAVISHVGRRKSFTLPQQLNQALVAYCQNKRVAPFFLFYTALAVYFRRTGSAQRFAIGVPVLNRTTYKRKQTTGMFVTTLPFYNEICDEWTTNRFVENMKENWYEMLRHQRFPFSRICDMAGVDGRLFHVALSYQDGQLIESDNPDVEFSGKWHYSGYQAEQLTIHMTSLFKNGCYQIDYDYLVQFFDEEEMEHLHDNLCEIMMQALKNPDMPIYKLPVICHDQHEKLIHTWNRTDRYIKQISVSEALMMQSREQGTKAALIEKSRSFTYNELFEKSSIFAQALMGKGLKKGELAAILLPRSMEMLSAMTGCLQAGGAYVILSESLPKERIRKIIEKSEARVLITRKENKSAASLCNIPILYTEEIEEGTKNVVFSKNGMGDDIGTLEDRLAYVVYTSGSTGEPKGVEITQLNLLNLAQEMRGIYGDGAVLSVCNVGFDAFMLESIAALLNGKTIVFPQEEAVNSPDELAKIIQENRIGTICMTPSRLSVLLLSEDFQKAAGGLECIICGGEPFPSELLRKLKKYTGAKIYNQYGPSEAAVVVSMKELSHAERITAGKPLGNCRLYVLDQWMNPLPAGAYGLLYVAGKCVGRGYRNAPELTKEVFMDSPFVYGEKMYCTGDVACWTEEGEIILGGRKDSQVKLRGLRIELQEISSCMESYPGVDTAAAVVMDNNGHQILAGYFSSRVSISEEEIRAHMAAYLPGYMIPSFIMKLDALPMSRNGKIDIKTLPMPLQADEKDVVLSTTAKAVRHVFCQVLGTEEIPGTGDYFLYGGNSLNAMETILKIQEVTGKKIRIADLYACRTAVKIGAYLDKATELGNHKTGSSEWILKKADKREYYPLSSVQQGMYIQSMLDPAGMAYHMPGAFFLEEPVSGESLKQAFKILVKEEPLLRTSFVQKDGEVCACVQEHAEFTLLDIQADDYEDAKQKFLRPISLDKAPLLRAGLWQSGEGQYLFMDMHHIIGDGMSTPLLLERLNLAYQNKTWNTRWNYYDYLFSCAQQKNEQEERDTRNYWKDILKNLPECLEFTDGGLASAAFDYKGRDYEYPVSKERSLECERFCREKGISEFALFLTAYGILLSEMTGKKDIVIGAPAAGRNQPGVQEIIGPFINTLPLRVQMKEERKVREQLEWTQKAVTQMLDHQNISLEEILQMLHLPRGEQNALYQVMMTQNPVEEDSFCLDGKKMSYRPISTGAAKMSLILELAKKEKQFVLRFSYAEKLFEQEKIGFYGRCMEQILGQLIQKEDISLREIRILAEPDYDRYVKRPNESSVPFETLPVHKQIKKMVLRKQQETAIIWRGEQRSYEWMERRACAIAGFIEKKGIQPGTVIALVLTRTPDMIAAMYGVWKAGCAYTFMLPTFPAARMTYMAEITNAGLILYNEEAGKLIPEGFMEGIDKGKVCLLPEGESCAYEDRTRCGQDLANVLFTSGSTGKPKGVMLAHQSFSNLCDQMKKLLNPIEGNVLCSTNSVFDCFVVETMIALALGRTVVLADEEEMMLPWKLAALVEKYETSIFEMTPSRLQMCLGNEAFCKAASHIKIVLLGGEAVSTVLMEKFYEHSRGVLMNMYGPTEATVFTTMEPLQSGQIITIGRPLQNTRTYVLDEKRRPVPPTACGELYIAGECLSSGYIGRPELTEDSFVEDIYYPGEKMYRSGDLVRQRLDGRYDYLGRKDAQVKLNGQRVELGEISGGIMESGYAAQAAVVPIRKEDGSMELCAFYVEAPMKEKAGIKDRITAYLKKILPVYMIPSYLIAVDNMPMTATNKIDMQALKEIGRKMASLKDKNHSPEKEHTRHSDMDQYVMSVWNQVLSVSVDDTGLSFFEIGGTSMAALNVLSRYYNDDLEMTLGQFYENPTVSGQAAFLQMQKKKRKIKFEKGKKAVLVTGATGFLGVHLVKELFEDGRNMICLLRDGGKERMRSVLRWYFGEELTNQMETRLSVIEGDLTKDQLGMEDAEYNRLSNKISEIYHAAADVRHYAAEKEAYLNMNIGGTRRLLELAKRADASFYHMSSCSIAGERMKRGTGTRVFTEHDFDIGQVWEDNIYVQSKFLAEELVFAAEKEGLHAKIFRIGRLVGRTSDGVFQKNKETNAFYLHLNGLRQLGAVPEEMAELPVDLMPVDMAAREILALTEGEDMVYHIMSHTPPAFKNVIEAIDKEIRIVSGEKMKELLKERKGGEADGAVLFLMEYLTRMSARPAQIQVVNDITIETLKRLGVSIEIPGPEQLLKGF